MAKLEFKRMISGAMLTVGILLAPLAAPTPALKAEEKFMADLRKAVDNRNPNATIVEQVLKLKTVKAIPLLGMIGDDRICQKLAAWAASGEEPLVKASLEGLGYCRSDETRLHLRELIEKKLLEGEMLAEGLLALSYQAKKEDLPLIFSHYSLRPKTVEAMMQASAYMRVSLDDLGPVDWNIAKIHLLDRQFQGMTLYMLGRIGKIETVIQFDRVRRSFDLAKKYEDIDSMVMAIRLMAKYPEAEAYFVDLLKGGEAACEKGSDRAPGTAALRLQQAIYQFSPSYKGEAFLKEHAAALNSNCQALQSVALAYAARYKMAIDYQAKTKSPTKEIAMRAYGALYKEDPHLVEADLVDLFTGDDYYKAYKAMGMLATRDSGKRLINSRLDQVKFPILKNDVAYEFEPKKVVAENGVRKGFVRLPAHKKTVATLVTTKGTVKITLDPVSFAAANFRDLINAKRLDGMVWHRVIANFVAQAGQTSHKFDANWSAIRDEWEGKHTIGSVGVATDGKDTGSDQFFININYNRHLDRRYTVFGQVTEGMAVVYDLMEGDIILSATVVSE